MTRLSRLSLPTIAATLLFAGCDATAPMALQDGAPSAALAKAPHANASVKAKAGKAGKKFRGRAIIDMWASPATNGLAGITNIRFRGVTLSGRPIAGEGTVVRSRFNPRRQVYTFTVEISGHGVAGPFEGRGRVTVSAFDEEYTMDGDDLFMEGLVLSFDAEYTVDGDDL